MELCINENTVFVPDALDIAIKNGRLSHAVILDGSGSDERYAVARYIARSLVCRGKQKPCGECSDCIKAESSSHPDIYEYSGGETARSFSVDKIREIRAQAYIIPNEADRKVFILRNVSSMSEQAQNALLKVLEEPPAFVTFILECGSKSMLLPTVLSRSSVYSLGDEKTGGADPEKLQKAKETAKAIVLAACKPGEINLLKATAVFEKDKELLRLCLPEIKCILGAALRQKYTDKKENETASALSEALSASRLLSMINAVDNCSSAIKRNANHNLLITKLCCELSANN
ncbi:MAG: ATP-binding protein [Clostridiales bacterium]|nr:ATP-binding protein [Clostridiales bacterium]